MHTFIRGDDHLSLVVDQQDGVTYRNVNILRENIYKNWVNNHWSEEGSSILITVWIM